MSDPAPVPPSASGVLGLRWAATAPIRRYIRQFPIQRGKGFLIRNIVMRALPGNSAVFAARLPGGGVVNLHPRETVGLSFLLYGGFETAEIACAISHSVPGTTTFDVGANVGIYAVALAGAVGPHGQVVAIEPDKSNIDRLHANLALGSIANVRVVEAVASDRDGTVELHIADDPAYNSIGAIEGRHSQTRTALVASMRLDEIWDGMGRPTVSFVKVDVEGAEVQVLRGAAELISATLPALLVEANDVRRLTSIRSVLEPLGYRDAPQPGFLPWNHLFLRPDVP